MSDHQRMDTLDPELKDGYPANFLAAYQQLCTSYHAIDDFRAKLLGFLPLATGTGIALLAKIDLAKQFLGAIGAFGFVIALGLFFYELHGIKKCAHLMHAGKKMESDMGIYGQFRSRPQYVAGFINEPCAASVIYPAVLAAWTYLALVHTGPEPDPVRAIVVPEIAIVVFIISFAVSFYLNHHMGNDLKNVI
jgi:FtsH-binding integral membrane protein